MASLPDNADLEPSQPDRVVLGQRLRTARQQNRFPVCLVALRLGAGHRTILRWEEKGIPVEREMDVRRVIRDMEEWVTRGQRDDAADLPPGGSHETPSQPDPDVRRVILDRIQGGPPMSKHDWLTLGEYT